MSPTESSGYRFGLAIGLALAGIAMLGWQALEHEPYRALYDELSGSAAVLPLVTTIVLSMAYRVGVPAGLLVAVIVLQGRRSTTVAAVLAGLAWAAVVIGHFGATAPLRMLSQNIQGP